MTEDQFTSFGAALSTDGLSIGGLTLNSDGLQLTYQAATGDFVITGDAVRPRWPDCRRDARRQRHPGTGDVQNGQFESLNMTVDSTITVGGLSFTSQSLNFTYDTATEQFTMTGNAGVTLGDDSVSVSSAGARHKVSLSRTERSARSSRRSHPTCRWPA